MLRRQALGVISNQYSNQQVTANLNQVKPLKSNLTLHNSQSENVFIKKSNEFDFEIFQEDENRLAVSDKENIGISLNKKQEKVVFSNDYFEEENREHEKENTTDQEQGISPFKSFESLDKFANLKEVTNITMDSPMLLDETNKFTESCKADSETESEESDETKALKLIEERENLLVNCDEYKNEILSYMRQEEQVNRPKPNYMKKQQDITSSMRSILIDWLVEVSEEYKLNIETLYLAVNYTDRFLSQMSVLRGKLQLVGTASMYIAAKYEEISPPDVTEFVYITDDTYTKKQVLRMEHLLLKVLDFRMNTPTCNCFLTHYLRFLRMSNLNQSEKVEHLSRYLTELTLIESDTYLNFLPSQIAASAIYLSMYTLGKKWTKQVADQLGYDFDLIELKDCIIALHSTMKNAPSLPQQAIQEKYKSHRFNNVASLEAPLVLSSIVNQ